MSAQRSVTIIAHRGLSEGLPENTLAAFRRSIERGVPIIELDVRATRDGQLVIIHDATLDRTTNCSGRVAHLTLARIKTCDAGGSSHPGERVPTLAEALALIEAMPTRLLLDIKAGTPLAPVLREIREHRAETRIVLGVRRATDIAYARRGLPGVQTLGFVPDITDAPAFAKTGAHAIRLWSDWVEADATQIGRARSLGPEVWIMVGRKLPRKDGDWRALHRRMLVSGAQALITDRPELVERP